MSLTLKAICKFTTQTCLADGNVKGISSYVANPDEAGQSLESCIKSKAKKLIPSYLQDKSPIYLGATAGMRLLK